MIDIVVDRLTVTAAMLGLVIVVGAWALTRP